MGWSEWKKFGASHLVIPLQVIENGTSTTFDKVTTLYTNDTNGDVILYWNGFIGSNGSSSSPLLRFKTSDNVTIKDFKTAGFYENEQIIVPKGKTLQTVQGRNGRLSGTLVDYEITPNQPLED